MFKVPGIDIGAGKKEIQLNPFKWFGGGGGTAFVIPPAVHSEMDTSVHGLV